MQPLSANSQIIARDIAKKLFQQRLEKELLNKLDERDTKIDYNKCYISNSQLSRLATVARKGLQEGSLEPVRTLLKSEHLTKNALTQFKRTEMESSESFYEKLKFWIEYPKNLINNLQDLDVTINDDIKQSLTDELAVEYTLKLIMAIAKKATKEKNNE